MKIRFNSPSEDRTLVVSDVPGSIAALGDRIRQILGLAFGQVDQQRDVQIAERLEHVAKQIDAAVADVVVEHMRPKSRSRGRR